jgi:CelD/BcsL family acetyltransferase involved in cellulose biosynthesis
MISASVVTDLGALEERAPEWDALAVAAAKPYCAPGWLIPWWRHMAPAEGSLRVVTVEDESGLAGIAPLFVSPGAAGPTLRPLGVGTCLGVEPLARAGSEAEVAQQVLAALDGSEPRANALILPGLRSDSPWPDLLARSWPGRRRAPSEMTETMPAPVLRLAGTDAKAWHDGRGSLHRELGRRQRRFLEEGGTFRLVSSAAEVPAAVHALVSLHEARWIGRGGSGVTTPSVEVMLAEAAHMLCETARLRLFTLDLDGATVAAALFLAAGGEVAYWLGGFDERIARSGPSKLLILEAIEDAVARGDATVDLGAGGQPYKLDFTADARELRWTTIVRPGRGELIRSARLAPQRLRRWASRTLPDERKRQLRRLTRRAGRP